MIKYKECSCDDDYWEIIVVKDDVHYNYQTVIYYHCTFCSEDFRVEDFETGEEVFYNDRLSKSSSQISQ